MRGPSSLVGTYVGVGTDEYFSGAVLVEALHKPSLNQVVRRDTPYGSHQEDVAALSNIALCHTSACLVDVGKPLE